MSRDSESGEGDDCGPGKVLKTTFLETLRADFAVHGADVIAACRADDPLQYIKLIAALLPKDAAPRPQPAARSPRCAMPSRICPTMNCSPASTRWRPPLPSQLPQQHVMRHMT
jgi:hypothetical protein